MISETSPIFAASRFLRLHFNNDLQEIVTLAAEVCNTPAAALFLFDRTAPWVSKRTAVNGRTCLQMIARGMRSIRHGASLDALAFSHATQAPFEDGGLRFYAGVPLQHAEGNFGMLCVLDEQARTIVPEQTTVLRLFSKQVVRLTGLAAALDLHGQPPHEVEAQRQRILAQCRSLQSINTYLTRGDWVYPGDLPARTLPNRRRNTPASAAQATVFCEAPHRTT